MTGMVGEELLWESRENVLSQYRSRATETIFMALDTWLVSVDRSVPASTGKRGCRPSQAPHPPVPAAAQGASSSLPGTAQLKFSRFQSLGQGDGGRDRDHDPVLALRV